MSFSMTHQYFEKRPTNYHDVLDLKVVTYTYSGTLLKRKFSINLTVPLQHPHRHHHHHHHLHHHHHHHRHHHPILDDNMTLFRSFTLNEPHYIDWVLPEMAKVETWQRNDIFQQNIPSLHGWSLTREFLRGSWPRHPHPHRPILVVFVSRLQKWRRFKESDEYVEPNAF